MKDAERKMQAPPIEGQFRLKGDQPQPPPHEPMFGDAEAIAQFLVLGGLAFAANWLFHALV